MFNQIPIALFGFRQRICRALSNFDIARHNQDCRPAIPAERRRGCFHGNNSAIEPNISMFDEGFGLYSALNLRKPGIDGSVTVGMQVLVRGQRQYLLGCRGAQKIYGGLTDENIPVVASNEDGFGGKLDQCMVAVFTLAQRVGRR